MKFKLLRAGLILGVTSLLFITHARPTRCALPACDIARVFYTDGTFNTVQGIYHVTCSGIVRTGHSSNYWEQESNGSCGDAECPDSYYQCSNGTVTASSVPSQIGTACHNSFHF
jgi:hypothetical protein